MDVVHLSRLDDQHRADIFPALEEMPSVSRLRADETGEVQGVVGIREDQEVFLRTTHRVSLARTAIVNAGGFGNDEWTARKERTMPVNITTSLKKMLEDKGY